MVLVYNINVVKKSLHWFLVALLIASSFAVGFGVRKVEAEDRFPDFELFWEVMETVRKHYYKPLPESRELVYGAIRGLLSAVGDDYTRFMEPRAYDNMQAETSGEFGGVGIQIGIRDNKLMVIAPMEGTPAERAGLKAGDWITEVDGKSTKDMALEEAVSLIRGPKGTEVVLTVLREGEKDPLKFPVKRDTIKIRSVEGKLVGDAVGHVRLIYFSEVTSQQMRQKLQELKSKGMRSVALDLRFNPGGLLDAAVEVCSLFVKEGEPVVQIEQGKSKIKRVIRSRGPADFADLPMVVLVNAFSASASEIVTGCLQDHKLATVVGARNMQEELYKTGRTFGKGSVQTVYPMRDGSAVAVTTAHYLTALGNDIDKKGIEPDVIVDVPAEEYEKIENGQLEKAKELLKAKVLGEKSRGG